MKPKLYHYCLLFVLICSGCTVYNINVEKNIIINGEENNPVMNGSDLDDIEGSPENKPDTDLTIPAP